MKIFTLRNFIFLMIIVVIIHQVIFSTSIPMIIPMENIDIILCSTPQRDVPSHINMNFSSPKAIIPDITDIGPQPNYSPLKNYAFWFYLRRNGRTHSYMHQIHLFYLFLLAHVVELY